MASFQDELFSHVFHSSEHSKAVLVGSVFLLLLKIYFSPLICTSENSQKSINAFPSRSIFNLYLSKLVSNSGNTNMFCMVKNKILKIFWSASWKYIHIVNNLSKSFYIYLILTKKYPYKKQVHKNVETNENKKLLGYINVPTDRQRHFHTQHPLIHGVASILST